MRESRCARSRLLTVAAGVAIALSVNGTVWAAAGTWGGSTSSTSTAVPYATRMGSVGIGTNSTTRTGFTFLAPSGETTTARLRVMGGPTYLNWTGAAGNGNVTLKVEAPTTGSNQAINASSCGADQPTLCLYNANTAGLALQASGGVTITRGDLQISSGKLLIKNYSVEAPDYVFGKNYELRPLKEVETFIKENKHLPEVPSAEAIKKDGVDMVEMNMTLLKKVEELTLYVIEQDKKIADLQKRVGADQ